MYKLLTIALIFMVGGLAFAQMPVAALPRTYIDTTWNPPQGGTIWAAHTAVQFTSALQVATPGDTIVLDAGTVYSGYFTVPAKSNSNKKWIYVTSSAYAKLPAPGTRVSPTIAANMPKIVTPGTTSALRFADGANHWRFVGIEIYSASSYHPPSYTTGVNFGYALVDKLSYPGTSNIPDSIFFDRCYVHGDATHDLQEGVVLNFTNAAVVDSNISEIHAKGVDTQAVLAYVTPGPIKLANNHLEAAGENVMLGGAGKGVFGYVPSDIEVRNNYIYKPLAWVPLSLPPINQYVVKNSFELKSAQRVLFDNNIIENKWAAGQIQGAFLFTPRTSQSGDVAVVLDVTVTNNIFKNVISGFNMVAVDGECGTAAYPACRNAGKTGRWNISNNLVMLMDNTAQGSVGHIDLMIINPSIDLPNGGVFVPAHDIVLQHNTEVPFGKQTCWGSVYVGVPAALGRPPFMAPPTTNIWILDNVLCRQPTGDWGQQGTAGLTMYAGLPNTPPYDLTRRFYGNVLYVPTGDRTYSFPPHNYATTLPVSYLNQSAGNYQLQSPYWTDTTDGRLAGVNFAKLPASATQQ
jgi:hypothetical protein